MKVAVSTLIFCVASLLTLGMVMLYSSSMTQEGSRYLTMQLIWCGLGLACCVTAASVDYQILRKLAWPMLAIAVVMLVLVLVPQIGVKIKGARRWFDLGGFRFQPSEFAKIALVVALAWYGERFQRQMPTFKRGILIPGIFIGVVLGLIFVEPDRGATVLLGAVSCVLLLVAGVRWRYFIPPMVAGVGALAFSIWQDPLRMKRILSWLYLEENKTGTGWQAYHGLLALGSGGWTGLGLGNSRQKLGYIPDHHTDFILPVIGEELGLIATLLIVLAFILIVITSAFIAMRSRDTFGMLLATGITFLIGFQAFINIGVVTSTLPNKGLPLPFISYGGSNLLLMLGCVGLLLSIARQARASEPALSRAADRDSLPAPQRA